ncbi:MULTISPECIES: DUF971 domain-containing protein [Anaeromyxobacter]|uniref:DUF971 domain-containing protein n=1 Tax=Anaeromyxobacter TaxID=161492 RepID=UPI001F565E07|nr:MULTISPECIES: DUF971 domain-containing protein [unclassified Anaeromyxobacter]
MGLLDRVSFKKQDVEPPEAIDLVDGGVRILWRGGPEVTLPNHLLRDFCPCAGCVEEGTGRKLLDPTTIPSDIRPLGLEAVGNYALRIRWSDGHDTGIYSWETLRRASGLWKD